MARILCVGHAVQDFIFSAPELPSGGHKFRADGFRSVGGGPAATAAVAIANLGGKPALAARVGDDAVADAIIGELEGYHVDCANVRRFPGRASSLSAVIVDSAGERMIMNYRDDAMPADAGWVAAAMAGGADAVLADTRWPEGAAAALAAARAAGVPGVLDADAPVPDDPALLAAASHVAFSVQGLTGLVDEPSLESALLRFHRQYGGWACVTCGSDGVLVCADGHIERAPAFRTEVVDTLGAGDVWHGAFALALAEGAIPMKAVVFANAAAALKVSRAGGRLGAPTRTEVDRLLAAADTETREFVH